MTPEGTPKYFTNFESEALPKVTWEEMVESQLVISPLNVYMALKEAENLLTTHPGPNLERRQRLAPRWFGYWKQLLEKRLTSNDVELIGSDDKLIGFEYLASFLQRKYANKDTGITFNAGAEGHEGHLHAAKYMANNVPIAIWALEQAEYMKQKERKAHFLPLELRLSMWFYEPSVSHLAVLPKDPLGKYDNDHYNGLFIRSGAKYFFVHEKDPHLKEKLKRGGQDLSLTILQDSELLSTTEMVEKLSPEISLEKVDEILARRDPRIIPDLPLESTSVQVERLLPRRGKWTDHESQFVDENVLDFLIRQNAISYSESLLVE